MALYMTPLSVWMLPQELIENFFIQNLQMFMYFVEKSLSKFSNVLESKRTQVWWTLVILETPLHACLHFLVLIKNLY